MAKRSDSGRVREQNNLENVTGESQTPKTVRLVCILGTGKYIVDGVFTGKRYEFINNNAVEVNYDDAEDLLSRRRGGCCGNPTPTPIFMKT